MGLPYWLTCLAEAYGYAGEADEGLRLLTEALTAVEATGQRLWEAEVYRRKGELLRNAACGVQIAAWTPEACFRKGLDVARRQQAKLWELRAATSLAHLW